MNVQKALPAPPTLSGSELTVRALYLGDRIHVRGLEPPLATHPLVVGMGDNSWAVLFRYGAAVLVNATDQEQSELLAELRGRTDGLYDDPETEESTLKVAPERDEQVEGQGIIVHAADLGRVQVVAAVLAKSVALAHYEELVAADFDRIEPMAAELARRGRGGRSARVLLRDIGQSLLVQHKMVGRVEVPEKPELLWEHPELERLYGRLEDEFELRERHVALEHKVQLISTTASTLLEVIQTSRSLRVEWYIVILIVVEIAITLYAMAAGIY